MANVVIQINKSGADDNRRVIRNIMNLKNQLDDDLIQCEVVVFGEGMNLLLTQDELIIEQLDALVESGIKFIACSNTLSKRNVTQEELSCPVGSAGSGVAHLVRRQTEGWAYLAL
ncbi:DsrE family protein [Bacillus sp. NTK071]|uniref:DsrE family protein n=1 Tax=Bacillus sp. NTK071 TaxID=2802175 RepID=UPI001A8D59AF|nr:DsrE family protein [Bacillus sp. NTK071]MBN8208894.1 DsrE family protein [Bacillus sp. NTK071]